MALTLTYDPVLARVRLSADALGAATYCYVWRTLNNFLQYVTVRGGDRATVGGGVFALDDYEFDAGVPVTYRVQAFNASNVSTAVFDATITADPAGVFVKVVARPYLNRQVDASVRFATTRRARIGVFDVVGRSYPVAVTDVRGSRELELKVRTRTAAEGRDFDLLLASGEPIFVHAPSTNTRIPTGHFVIGDTTEQPTGRPGRIDERIFTLPLTEIATPGPHVLGAASTWQTVLNTYPTWNDVIAAHATWADLLELIGNPSEVIVP